VQCSVQFFKERLSMWLIGTVRAAAWNGYHPVLGSIPRPGKINCFRIIGVHASRLISRTGKRVWRCPL